MLAAIKAAEAVAMALDACWLRMVAEAVCCWANACAPDTAAAAPAAAAPAAAACCCPAAASAASLTAVASADN